MTPSLDQGRFLEETIRSVLLQAYPSVEYVIVDGGSSDGSVSIIRRYERWLAWSVSEPDRGQAAAINKGLAHLGGEVFNWINSDDVLVPGALALVGRRFPPRCHAFAASCRVFGVGYQERSLANRRLDPVRLIRSRPGTRLQQQALWLRPELVKECGGIDEALHYFFDVELAIRYLARYPRVAYDATDIVRFRFHSASKSVARAHEFQKEYVRTLEKVRASYPSARLRRHAVRRLEELDRHAALTRLLDDTGTPRWRRALRLLRLACARPLPGLLRMSAAGLRRLLLGRPWIVVGE